MPNPSALAVLLVVGLIVAVVLLTQDSSKAPANSYNETANNMFLAELKPLLSQQSLTALNDS
jgi:hypothetical protein